MNNYYNLSMAKRPLDGVEGGERNLNFDYVWYCIMCDYPFELLFLMNENNNCSINDNTNLVHKK